MVQPAARKDGDMKDIAMRVSVVSIVVNVVLSAFKLFAGIVANSAAMVSDAIHSASDVFSTFVVMIGVSLASKEADTSHPYGHERLECVAAMLLAMILLATGLGIGYSGVMKVISGMNGELSPPGALALVAAVVSIAVKEWMFWYTRAAYKKTNFSALMADAWHHRSDAMSSVGSLVGIGGAMLGFPIMDPLACVVICLFIVKAAYDVFMDAVNKMADCPCDDETIQQMTDTIRSQAGVHSLDEIKTRQFGSRMYVDVEIGVSRNFSLDEAHDIAHCIHDEIEKRFTNVKHCMVHVNPADAPKAVNAADIMNGE